MQVNISQIPSLLEIQLEPTERRHLRLIFFDDLALTIDSLTVIDPDGSAEVTLSLPRAVNVTLSAGVVGSTAEVTIAATAGSHTNRQALRITTVDPAATYSEVTP